MYDHPSPTGQQVAMQWTYRVLHPVVSHTNVSVPLDEAEFNRDGGVGFPYKLDPRMVYKDDYVNKYADRYMDAPKEYPEGFSLPWDCFPKVEILPYEKALKKARIICASPVEHFLVGARLYTMFNKRLVAGPLASPSVVGLVPPYGGWRMLYDKLPGICENSDASRFDKSISPKLLKMVYLVRESLSTFNEYETKLHWWYFEHLVRRRSILSCGKVYLVHGGNGSGQYNTTHDNTIAHILALAYAAYMIGMSYEQFRRFPFFVYGDDYIGGALPGEFWERFLEFGFLINKTPPQSKLSCDFLSNRFVNVTQGITAVPMHDKALYSIYTSESKRWRDFREQKAYSLWLSNFFHPDRAIYEEILTYLGVPFSYKEAVDYWFGRLGGFKNQNVESSP